MSKLQEALDHAKERRAFHVAEAERYAAQIGKLEPLVKDETLAGVLDEVFGPRRVQAAVSSRRCSNCGETGHNARKCPKPYERPGPVATVSTMTKVIKKPAAVSDKPVPVTELAVTLNVGLKRLMAVIAEQKIARKMIGGVSHVDAQDVDRIRRAVAA